MTLLIKLCNLKGLWNKQLLFSCLNSQGSWIKFTWFYGFFLNHSKHSVPITTQFVDRDYHLWVKVTNYPWKCNPQPFPHEVIVKILHPTVSFYISKFKKKKTRGPWALTITLVSETMYWLVRIAHICISTRPLIELRKLKKRRLHYDPLAQLQSMWKTAAKSLIIKLFPMFLSYSYPSFTPSMTPLL